MRDLLRMLLLCVLAASPAAAAPLSAAALSADGRLASHVTLVEERVYLREVMQALEKQTGVALGVGPEGDGAGDEILLVSVRNVPLERVMNALWSQLSYRGAEWHWQGRKGEGGYRYTLIRSRAAQLLPFQLRAEADARLERHFDASLQAALRPEQAEKLIERDPALTGMRSPLRQGALRSALAALPRDALLEVLHDRQPRDADPRSGLTFRSDDLGPQVREWVTSTYSGPNAIVRGAIPTPQHLQIYGRRQMGDVSPMLMVSPDGVGSYPYIGGRFLEEAHRAALLNRWFHPNDRTRSALDEKILTQAPDPDSQSKPPDQAGPATIADRLLQLSELGGVPVIARLSPNPHRVAAEPAGKQVREYIREVAHRLSGGYLHKWRGDLLLLEDPAWYASGAYVRIPAEIARDLEARAEKGPELTPADLKSLAARLTAEQIIFLARNYGDLQAIAAWRELLAAAHEHPDLQKRLARPQGIRLRDLAPAVIQALPERWLEVIDPGSWNSYALRLHENAGEARGQGAALAVTLLQAGRPQVGQVLTVRLKRTRSAPD